MGCGGNSLLRRPDLGKHTFSPEKCRAYEQKRTQPPLKCVCACVCVRVPNNCTPVRKFPHEYHVQPSVTVCIQNSERFFFFPVLPFCVGGAFNFLRLERHCVGAQVCLFSRPTLPLAEHINSHIPKVVSFCRPVFPPANLYYLYRLCWKHTDWAWRGKRDGFPKFLAMWLCSVVLMWFGFFCQL